MVRGLSFSYPIESAYLATSIHTAAHRSPKQLLIELNRMLFVSIERQSFVTMIYGVINIPTKKFTFARAGHNPLLKMGLNGDYQLLTPPGIGLGLDTGEIFEKQLAEVTIDLKAHEILVFYTDGITEARNVLQDEFGEERMLNTFFSAEERDIVKLRESFLVSLENFMAGAQPHDDITMVLIQCLS